MTIRTGIEVSPDRGCLKVAGRFDFHLHQAFNIASRKLLAECHAREVTIEMADVTYIDSSALGMLLVLREDAGRHGVTVALGHCKPFILRILRTAMFDKLFAIAIASD